MKDRSKRCLFFIAIIGYFLIGMALLLLGGNHPVIQIQGINATRHEEVHLVYTLIFCAVADFGLMLI